MTDDVSFACRVETRVPLEEWGKCKMVRDPWHLIGSYVEVCGGRRGLSACLNPSEALLEQHLMGAANYTLCH